MEELLKEIYEDIINEYKDIDYVFHDKELGYDTFEFSIHDEKLFVVQNNINDEGNLELGSNAIALEEIKKIDFEIFERHINTMIYYMHLEEVN